MALKGTRDKKYIAKVNRFLGRMGKKSSKRK